MEARGAAPYVRARGSRYGIGYEHGRAARDLVRGTLEWSIGQLAAGGVDRAEGLRRAAVMLDIVRRHTPDLADEVRGIAEGAGLTVDEAALINARYELLFLHGPEAPDSRIAGAGCTLFGLTGRRTADGAPIIGQNVDLGPESRPYWIVLDVTPDGGPRVLTATLAGMLAQEGINGAGLALCGSMVRSRGWRTGYPTRKFLRRRVLEQPSVAAAIDTIRAAPRRASSHNLLLADASGRVADVETTVDAVRVIEPRAGVVVHSNHYLSPDLEGENDLAGGYLPHTVARCARMLDGVREAAAGATVARLADLLRDHTGGARAVCRHAATDEFGMETNIAVVSEPAARRIHIAFGPPCEAPFETYDIAQA